LCWLNSTEEIVADGKISSLHNRSCKKNHITCSPNDKLIFFCLTHVAIICMDGIFRCFNLLLFYMNMCKSCISINHCILFSLQMLGFFKNYKFAIHFQSLQFWLVCCGCTIVLSGGGSSFLIILSYLPFLATNVYLQVLMRDLLSKPKSSTHSAADSSAVSGSGSENAKKKTLSFVNDDFCGAILDTSFPRMLKREKILPGTALSLGALELWSDDFEDKSKFSQYRSRLVCLIGIYKFTYYCLSYKLFFPFTYRNNFCYGTSFKEVSILINLFIICIWSSEIVFGKWLIACNIPLIDVILEGVFV